MSNWRVGYLRAFIVIIGFAFILVGVALSFFASGGFNLSFLFKFLGIFLVFISVYWWYKDFQKK